MPMIPGILLPNWMSSLAGNKAAQSNGAAEGEAKMSVNLVLASGYGLLALTHFLIALRVLQ
jgi:hypothetical protein